MISRLLRHDGKSQIAALLNLNTRFIKTKPTKATPEFVTAVLACIIQKAKPESRVPTTLCKMSEQVQNHFATVALLLTRGNFWPFRWNPDNRTLHHIYDDKEVDEVVKLKSSFSRQLIFRKIFYICLVTQEIAALFNKSNYSIGSKAFNWFTVCCLLFYNVIHHICHSKSKEIVKYVTELNLFLKNSSPNSTFEEIPVPTFRDCSIKIMVKVCLLSAIVVPLGFVFGMHWRNPEEKSSLVGYWILTKANTFSGMFLKMAVFLVNYWSWQVTVPVTVFVYGGILMICSLLLIECIRTFWKVEMAGNKSSLQKAILYRRLQLISALQTEILSECLLPTCMVMLTLGVAIASATFVGLPWMNENFGIIVLAGYFSISCVLAMLIMVGCQAYVFEESNQMFKILDKYHIIVHGKMTKSIPGAEFKTQLQFWKSCENLIKVKFGFNNYVESETPLNCLNWAVALAVQILLMREQSV